MDMCSKRYVRPAEKRKYQRQQQHNNAGMFI